MRTHSLPLFLGLLLLTACATASPGNQNSSRSSAMACTMDAKLCPDGSYVGRTGPNCTFAPCPMQDSSMSSQWSSFSSSSQRSSSSMQQGSKTSSSPSSKGASSSRS